MPDSKRPGSKYVFITLVFDGLMRTTEPGWREESAVVFLWGDRIQYSMWLGRSKVGNGRGVSHAHLFIPAQESSCS